MPDAMALYAAVAPLQPVILTGLPRTWAERHLPGAPVITTTAALKREHCHPGDALVDDSDQYRRLWEGAGGVFVRHVSAARSIEALARLGFLARQSAAMPKLLRRRSAQDARLDSPPPPRP